jgi:type I restriction enzyme M protein
MSSKKYLRGFDNDSGMTILRIGSMNLMLYIIPLWDGIESPQFYCMDSLSKSFDDECEYDVILMNPPFRGAVDKGASIPANRHVSTIIYLTSPMTHFVNIHWAVK